MCFFGCVFWWVFYCQPWLQGVRLSGHFLNSIMWYASITNATEYQGNTTVLDSQINGTISYTPPILRVGEEGVLNITVPQVITFFYLLGYTWLLNSDGPCRTSQEFSDSGCGTATSWYSIAILLRRVAPGSLGVSGIGIFETDHCPCTFYITWHQVPCIDYSV